MEALVPCKMGIYLRRVRHHSFTLMSIRSCPILGLRGGRIATWTLSPFLCKTYRRVANSKEVSADTDLLKSN